MTMNSAPVHASPLPLFEAIERGEKKKAVLIEALRATPLKGENVDSFISAMNEVPSPVAAELISMAWPNLDVECRTHISRSWLDGKEKEQQAGGYHTLAARLLVQDSDTSMFFLDRVTKLAANSPPCRKRVISTTRAEWVGTTPEQSRFRALDPNLLATNGRAVLLDWLCESCHSELHPSDNERRRAELQKQTQARVSLVTSWFEQLRAQEIPESVSSAFERCLAKLRPKPPGGQVASPAPTQANVATPAKVPERNGSANATAPAPAAVAPVPLPAQDSKTATETSSEETDDMLRDAFNSIRRLFQKESDRHRRTLRSIEAELAAAKAQQGRAEHDAAGYRAANVTAAERVSALEEQVRVLAEAKEKTGHELAEARERLNALASDLDVERQQRQALREESHEAVSRETQRERERLLGQVGTQTRNLVEGYREIRSRGPLPDGAPRMVGDMMDELLSRLEAAGVRFTRE